MYFYYIELNTFISELPIVMKVQMRRDLGYIHMCPEIVFVCKSYARSVRCFYIHIQIYNMILYIYIYKYKT